MKQPSQRIRKIKLPLAVLAASSLVLGACSGGDDPVIAPSPSASATATQTASPDPTESAAPIVRFTAPLSGLPSEQEVTARPIAVMINNLKPARPQSGLTNADMVWEVLAEGGITRLVAFFQSYGADEPIGPIRSIRPYLIELGEMYGSVLAHAGASNDALAIIQRQGKPSLDEINNAGAYFYRDKSRKAPHNLYSTIPKLRDGASHRKYKDSVTLPSLKFSSAPDLTGAAPASSVQIKFELDDYKVSYAYDAGQDKYLRSINGQPHTDLNNGQQLKAQNLVVIGTKHKVYDSVGRLEIDLDSGGEALLFQQGKVIVCEWKREKGDSIRLYKDDVELPLVPGVTYYHIVPDRGGMASHVTYQ